MYVYEPRGILFLSSVKKFESFPEFATMREGERVDNLTHTLTGLMISRCGISDNKARGTALTAMIAANVPDIDVLWSGLPGGSSYFEYHRGITHSFVMAPILAAACCAIAKYTRQASINVRLFAVAVLGVLSHLLLDWTNVYGIRLLLPFSSKWYRGDMTEIIDPIILAILFLSLFAPMLANLVVGEIGAKKGTATLTWARFALVALLGYESARFVAHARALAMIQSHLYGGSVEPRFTVVPARLGLLTWRGIVEGEDYVVNSLVDITGEYNPADGHVDYPTLRSPMIDAARNTSVFDAFLRFNQVPFWRVIPTGDFIRVELLDLRFGPPWAPGFAAASALVNPDGHIREAHLGLGGR